jgi:hypothetical protein
MSAAGTPGRENWRNGPNGEARKREAGDRDPESGELFNRKQPNFPFAAKACKKAFKEVELPSDWNW